MVRSVSEFHRGYQLDAVQPDSAGWLINIYASEAHLPTPLRLTGNGMKMPPKRSRPAGRSSTSFCQIGYRRQVRVAYDRRAPRGHTRIHRGLGRPACWPRARPRPSPRPRFSKVAQVAGGMGASRAGCGSSAMVRCKRKKSLISHGLPKNVAMSPWHQWPPKR